jgi:hypothetical protein
VEAQLFQALGEGVLGHHGVELLVVLMPPSSLQSEGSQERFRRKVVPKITR